MCFWSVFQGICSPVTAHMLPQTTKGMCPVVEHLFDVYNNSIVLRILYFSSYMYLLARKKEIRKKELK